MTDTSVDVPSKPTIKLFPEQQEAKEAFLRWYSNLEYDGEGFIVLTDGKFPIFRIFGYAGTGKTTITKSIVEEIEGIKLYGAYTGKAALVMTRNDMPARTLHSLVYKPVLPDKAHCLDLRAKAKATVDADERDDLLKQVQAAEQLSFELNDESDLIGASLLILDECSMVNDEMLADIQSFGVPMLVLGDPGQLPPISGTGALVRDKPDVLLTTIHRQALDNPIIDLSVRARGGVPIPQKQFGTSAHIPIAAFSKEIALGADQILVGKNVTRIAINRKARKLLSFEGTYPVPGDKLICLRTERKLGIFNGLICTCVERGDDYPTYIEYRIRTEEDRELVVPMHRAFFDEYDTPGIVKALKWWDFKDTSSFDYGYAITVHKSQGSQWDNVVFYDDKFFTWDPKNRKRWLYTGITRAAERLTLVS